MGTFNVDLHIGKPDLSSWETVSVMVDTGATYSMAPASLLHRLGVEPAQITEFELAGGEIVTIRDGISRVFRDGQDRLGAHHFRAGRRIFDGRDGVGRPGFDG